MTDKKRRGPRKGFGGKVVYVMVSDIADELGWRTERTRNFLKKHKALRKVGDRYYTTAAILEGCLPELASIYARRNALERS